MATVTLDSFLLIPPAWVETHRGLNPSPQALALVPGDLLGNPKGLPKGLGEAQQRGASQDRPEVSVALAAQRTRTGGCGVDLVIGGVPKLLLMM